MLSSPLAEATKAVFSHCFHTTLHAPRLLIFCSPTGLSRRPVSCSHSRHTHKSDETNPTRKLHASLVKSLQAGGIVMSLIRRGLLPPSCSSSYLDRLQSSLFRLTIGVCHFGHPTQVPVYNIYRPVRTEYTYPLGSPQFSFTLLCNYLVLSTCLLSSSLRVFFFRRYPFLIGLFGLL